MTLISVYAPTMTRDDCDKETFYASLHSTVSRVQPSDKLFVLGDFNARVGREAAAWPGVLGSHGVGNMNNNGLLLFTKCTELDLALSNTHFRQKDKYKFTWMHPRSRRWHLLDYMIVRPEESE